MKEIRCSFCDRVMRQVKLTGARRFFCWLLGHRISRAEFHSDGVKHPEKNEYCHEEHTCKYCRKCVSVCDFA